MNYYTLLTVAEDADAREVQAAFRRMVKKCHPDVNAHRRQWAHQRMKDLIEAYEVLKDEAKRAAYDRKLAISRNSQRDMYRERLAAATDAESRSKLVLYDLLRGSAAEAVRLYEAALAEDLAFDVARHLPPRDWMDCKFLLGEEYHRRKAYLKALGLFEAIYFCPLAKEHYRHFLHEVAERIRSLCCRDLARGVPPAEAVAYYERALRLSLRRADKAFMYKKMAECHCESGDDARARECLARALEMKPDLKGCQKIRRRLGLEA